jgi:uncharacterized OsmC-like protein
VDASGGRLTAEAVGEVETEGKVLILRRIHVRYELKAPPSARETVERVHAVHAQSCPVYRSLEGAIAITTEYRLAPD